MSMLVNSFSVATAVPPITFGPTVASTNTYGTFTSLMVGGLVTAAASGTINNLWILGGDTSYPSNGFRLAIYGPVLSGPTGSWGAKLGEVAFTGMGIGATVGGAMGGPVTITNGSVYALCVHSDTNGLKVSASNATDGGGNSYFWSDAYSDGADSSGPTNPSLNVATTPTIWGTT